MGIGGEKNPPKPVPTSIGPSVASPCRHSAHPLERWVYRDLYDQGGVWNGLVDIDMGRV